MIIAAIARGSGQLVISIENHPKTGASMVVVAHVAANETITCRSPLQPSELPQVIAALQVAATKLKAPGNAQHRTVRAADMARQLEEDRRLF